MAAAVERTLAAVPPDLAAHGETLGSVETAEYGRVAFIKYQLAAGDQWSAYVKVKGAGGAEYVMGGVAMWDGGTYPMRRSGHLAQCSGHAICMHGNCGMHRVPRE